MKEKEEQVNVSRAHHIRSENDGWRGVEAGDAVQPEAHIEEQVEALAALLLLDLFGEEPSLLLLSLPMSVPHLSFVVRVAPVAVEHRIR